MPTFRDNAIVLRTHNLGEADRIVTVLSQHYGKLRVVGKGVRRTKSKFGSRLEPFMHIDLQYYQGKSLDTVTQVATLDAFANPISQSYGLFTAGVAILEAADRLVAEERQPARSQFLLLLGAIRALASQRHAAELVLDSYLLRAFGLAGWAPALANCAVCGAPGLHSAFATNLGGSVCSDCRPSGTPTTDLSTMKLMQALLNGNWDDADKSSSLARQQAAKLITQFTQYQLERDLRALKHVDRAA